MKKHELLAKAAQVLNERGWCKGYGEEAGPMCIMHALRVASGVPSYNVVPPNLGEARALIKQTFEDDRFVGDWNDYVCKDQAEAIAVVDAAYVEALYEEGLEAEDVL